MFKLSVIGCTLFASSMAFAEAPSVICKDSNALKTFVINISGYKKLKKPDEKFVTILSSQKSNGLAQSVTEVTCSRPAGNKLTAEMPPVLVCLSSDVSIDGSHAYKVVFSGPASNLNAVTASIFDSEEKSLQDDLACEDKK